MNTFPQTTDRPQQYTGVTVCATLHTIIIITVIVTVDTIKSDTWLVIETQLLLVHSSQYPGLYSRIYGM